MRPSFARVHGQAPAVARPFTDCVREHEIAAAELFAMDPQIMSVGIGSMPGGYGFRVVRRRAANVRALQRLDAHTLATGVRGIAIDLHEVQGAVRAHVKVARLGHSSLEQDEPALPEQDHRRPLCAGLQLQNWDADAREGLLEEGCAEVGSLGMLLAHGERTLMLSNNHVLAGQNRGRLGDRIAQPGGEQLEDGDVIARLERFVELRTSPIGAHPRWGNVLWNEVDAAVAVLAPERAWASGFLPHHRLPTLRGTATPTLGDEVFKVGRTTGLTRGRIVSVSDRVGPVGYGIGDCWFRGSFTIEGFDGQAFSDGGDSGAAIVRGDGEVLGLIYAGNGVDTYACPIADVLAQLGLSSVGH
jgi:hypothetical protein